MLKRTILTSMIAGLLASGGAAVASGGPTATGGGDREALARTVVTTGTCVGGARYRATMENDSYLDESGTRHPSVYVTVVVSNAGVRKEWDASGEITYRRAHGTQEHDGFMYVPFRSRSNGTITFETDIPGDGWHRYQILARRLDNEQRCRLSLRA